ncbi:MAG: hypothetical protein FWH27_11115 [Planctomycetaceae bacterium]|nr:hypothetical protein [Planctomycetaceae bacterium]
MSMTILLTVFAFLIQSTLLLMMGFLTGVTLGRNRVLLRQIVYRMTLVAVPVLPVISLLFLSLGAPGFAVCLPDSFQTTRIAVPVEPAVVAGDENACPLPHTTHTQVPSIINDSELPGDRQPAFDQLQSQASIVPTTTPDPETPQSLSVASRPSAATAVRVFLAIWGLGVLLFAARWIRSQHRAATMLRTAVTVEPALMLRLATCAERLGVKQPVRLLQSPFLSSPCLLGIRRPTVLLPDALPHSDRELDAILVHELAHLLRNDIAWLLLARIVTALAFFQPLLWVIKRKIHQTSEEICDDEVLRFGIDSNAYAGQLLDVAAKYLPGETLPDCVLTMASRKSRLRLRVERILDSSRMISAAVSRKSLLFVAAMILLLTLITGSFSIEASRGKSDLRDPNPTLATLGTQDVVESPKNRMVLRRIPYLSDIPFIGVMFQYQYEPPAQPQQPPTSITCRVLDSEGNPISGAKVIVRLLREDSTRELKEKPVAKYRLRSNSQGEYRFAVTSEQAADPELRIHIAAAHPDYISCGFIFEKYQNFIELYQLSDNELRTSITLDPSAKVTGKVLKPDGKPAASVLVYASSGDINSVQTSTRTDAEGNFTIGTQLAKYEKEYYKDRLVHVLPKDYAPLAFVLNDEDADLGTVQLQEGIVLKGQAVDCNGNPVPNVWLSLMLNDSPGVRRHGHDASCRAAVTDADGYFQFRPVMPGDYHIETGLLMEYDRDDWVLAPESAYVNLADADFWTGKPLPRKELPSKNEAIPFPRKMVTITNKPVQEVEYRALETVDCTIQVTNDFVKTHSAKFGLRGQLAGQHWSTDHLPAGNESVVKVPVGLKDAYLTLWDMDGNHYYPLRFRMSETEPWTNNWYATIGDMERGANLTVEVQPCEPGVLKIACLEPDGNPLPQNGLDVRYKNVAFEDPKIITINGDTVMTGIERHSPSVEFAVLDGRQMMWRYHPVLADEEFVLSASGFDDQGRYEPVEQTLSLRPGELREMKVTLKERVKE